MRRGTSYRARTRFADLEDGGRIYEAGERFPRPGLKVSEKRIKALLGSENLAGKSLIEAVGEDEPVERAQKGERRHDDG